jgi:hypothetical protein
LLTQLNDLEELKDDMDADEYEQSRNETLDQMKEFNASLDKMASGDMTLVDDIGKMQLAIQKAVSTAFKSPEISKMFEKKENAGLRGRLATLEESFKLGRITEPLFDIQKRELLVALEKLGDELTDIERAFISKVSNGNTYHYHSSLFVDQIFVLTTCVSLLCRPQAQISALRQDQ